ncbi:Deoxyribonuclease TatD [Raoultella terrigena]|uniref:Deoxyribonuclease TatD n=1 Tax=Raoultella terrigena TaxID=577 RepID=A0A4U9D3W5_RAOTE|nr:Deoxyribonuclease TatD [Raoultella terrigena]
MARRYSRCWSTAGVHPHDSSSWTEFGRGGDRRAGTQAGSGGNRWNAASISTATFRLRRSRKRRLAPSLALAAELSLPVFLHCRDAHERFLTLLAPWLDKLPGAVLHCFTGSRDEVRACLERGLYIGSHRAGYATSVAASSCAIC